jgi:flagellar hook-length control protein FliK
MVVRLDPPELGSVTVRLSMRGEQMYARVVPENSEVETVLRERAQEIVQALSNSGVKAENINLTIGRESQEFSSLFYDQNRSAQHQSTGGDSQFEGQFSPRQGERDWRGSDDEGKERAEAPSGWVA